MKTKILFLGLMLSLLTISCSKDKADNTNSMTVAEATSSAKMDAANDDVSSIVEDQVNVTLSDATGKVTETAAVATTNLPSCATVTRNPALGTVLTAGQTVTKTIDFGTAGCALSNGNVLKGQIVITWVYQPVASSQTVNYQFVNFYHNYIKYDGNKTFTRTMSSGTTPHPIVTMTMDMTATFPNGDVYSRTGTRTREIIAGFDTPNVLVDNVYQVTGNWTTTFPSGTVRYSTITSPLILKLQTGCSHHFVQGIISFVQNNNTATLDYGDGTCDDIAVFTINGVAHTITL